MKNAKLKHILEICMLLILTAGVLFCVVQTQGKYSVPSSGTAQTTAAEMTAEPETTETQTQTQAQTTQDALPSIVYAPYEPSTINDENFRDTIVLGNSQAQALSLYGLMKNADFATKVGLSINHVLQSNSGTPPINQLQGKQYKKAVFIFGENELGWPNPKNFINYYKKVIAKVREMNPGVQVYVQAVFPVAADYSEKSTNGINNENVRIFNDNIREMCEEIDAVFMPVSQAFFDENGALPAGIAKDGVHFCPDYCKIWAGDISAYLASEPQTDHSAQEETTA